MEAVNIKDKTYTDADLARAALRKLLITSTEDNIKLRAAELLLMHSLAGK